MNERERLREGAIALVRRANEGSLTLTSREILLLMDWVAQSQQLNELVGYYAHQRGGVASEKFYDDLTEQLESSRHAYLRLFTAFSEHPGGNGADD